MPSPSNAIHGLRVLVAADADAEMAAEAGARCAPARPAGRRGSGADEPWACSQVEAIMASIVSNAEEWAHSPAGHGVQVCANPPGLAGKALSPHF